MKSFLQTLALPILLLVALASIGVYRVSAQESEPVVVDEVIAQVNNEVITLTQLNQEIQDAIEARKQQGATDQQAREEIERRKSELIALMITDQLLVQKGKELNLADDVEAEVNKRVLEVVHENHMNSIPELEHALEQSGQNLSAIRQTLRTEIMKQMVLSREVDAKVYFSLSPEELHRYFDAHRDQFRRNESVTLSEIFLTLAGRPEGEVRTKAQQLVAQARQPGADFAALAVTNSESMDANGQRTAPQTKGKLGTFEIAPGAINQKIIDALKSVPKGGVSDPIRFEDGYHILRVDDRTPAGEATFNENQVREAMLQERGPQEREAYIQKLRDDAYIKISESYRAAVEPLLKPHSSQTSQGTTTGAASSTSHAPAAPTNTNNSTQQQKKKSNSQNQRP